jgi:hypothetical protein
MAVLDVTLTINGVDYTGSTLGNVRIVRGREDVDTVARAGYVLAELLDETGNGFPVDLTDQVVVTIDNTTGPVTLFTGSISNVSTRLYAVRTGTRAIWQVLANGPVALANRRQVLSAGTSIELDGDLVLEILEAGLYQTWAEFQGTTWAAVDPTVTWATVDPGFDGSLVETPGEYEIAALDPQPEGYNALGLISRIVVSSGGSLFETGDGNVGYSSAYGRSERAAAGYTLLPVDQILASTLFSSFATSDLVNRIEVRYDGGAVEREDISSIGRYGVRESVLDTILANEPDAEGRAGDILFDLAIPRAKLPSVEFALHTLPDADVDLLLTIDTESPVSVPGLPTTLGNLFQRAFVEGVQYDLGSDRRQVTYYLSDHVLSLASTRWQDVDPTLAWEDVSATLEWADARLVTA